MKNILLLLILFCFGSCFKGKRSDHAAERMQEFVINISNYTRGIDPGFIIIPQNGAELAFTNSSPDEGLHASYMAAIDGVGIEELFYNGTYIPDEERISMLRKIAVTKKIMVSEFVSDNNTVADAIAKNESEGFICFPRENNNYDYLYIPSVTPNENTSDITSLDMVQNYLYMISTDNYSSKESMITAIENTNFDLILIDLFFEDSALSAADVSRMKTKANGGQRLVISYISIGSAEKFRYYWKKGWGHHHPLFLKRKYEGYEDEFWVKFWKKDWQEIIYGNDDSYMKKILNAGFDGAYLDNVEAYYFLYYKD